MSGVFCCEQRTSCSCGAAATSGSLKVKRAAAARGDTPEKCPVVFVMLSLRMFLLVNIIQATLNSKIMNESTKVDYTSYCK